MGSRSKKSILNFLSNNVFTLVTILAGFVLTPHILKYIGKSDFGVYRVLFDTFGYIALFEVALYGCLNLLLSKSLALSDERQTGRILRQGVKYYLGISIISILLVIALTPFLPHIIGNISIIPKDLNITFWILGCTLIFLPLNIVRSYVETKQKSYLMNIASIINFLTYFCLIWIFLPGRPSLSTLATAHLFGFLLSQLLVLGFSKIPLSLFFINKEKDTSQKFKHTFKNYGLSYLSLNLAGRVCLFTDNIIVSVILGASQVTPFFLTQRLPQTLQKVLQSIGQSTWASLGEIYHKEGKEKFSNKILELTKLTSYFSCSLLLPVFFLNKFFIELWVGADSFAGFWVSGLACFNAFMMSLLNFWGFTFTSSGKIHKVNRFMWGQALLNLSLSIILTWKIGMSGPLWGTAIAYFLYSAPYIAYIMKTFYGLPRRQLVLNSAIPFLLLLLIMSALYFQFGDYLNKQWSWYEVISRGVGLSLIYGVLGFHLLFKKQEKQFILQRIKHIISRKEA